MNHSHVLYDADPHFKINASTRNITNESGKTKLVQYDHNSERFTFDAPRVIEGHDLSECNCVEIHYLNIEANSKKVKSGVYTVTDLKVSEEDADTVVFSWLIGDGATQLIGQLNFLVRFSCVVESTSEVEYAWNTAIHVGTMISTGIYNSGTIVEENIEPLKAWKADLDATQIKKIEQTTVSDADGGTNVWTATFGDGRTSDFMVKNGSKGDTGLIGSIETVDGKPMHFFYGTKEQYDALSVEQKVNLFAVLTDDLDAQDVRSFSEWKTNVENGVTAVPKATALSTPKYMINVHVTGKSNSLSTITDIDFYFSFIANESVNDRVGAGGSSTTMRAHHIANADGFSSVMANGVFGTASRVYCVTKNSGNLNFGIITTDGQTSNYSSSSYQNLNYSVVEQLLTGGEG